MNLAPSFGALTDEELVALAKKADGQAAWDLLTLHYRQWLEHWVARHSRTRHLRPEDRQDARQQVLVAFCEAVRTFDPACIRAGQDHPFRAFLFHVARWRFANFARSVDRQRKHSEQSLDSVNGLDSQPCHLPGLLGCCQPSSWVGRDPALIAQDTEKGERLAVAVEQLTELQRRIWVAIRNRVPLRVIAEQFGVTYGCAWNWQQQIFAILREAVRDKSERQSRGAGNRKPPRQVGQCDRSPSG